MNTRFVSSARMMPVATGAPAGSAIVQRKCNCEAHPDHDRQQKKARRSLLPAFGEPCAEEVPEIVHDVLGSHGPGLSSTVRDYFEPRLYRDFSHVPARSGGAPQLSASTPLVVGAPADPCEVEADTFAERHSRPLDTAHAEGRYDLSGVRVHTGAQADASARAIGARAYAVGQHIVFAAGEFAPDTTSGRALLAHELAHVAQQGGSAARTLRRTLAGCKDLLAEPATRLIPGTLAHQMIQSDFTKVAGARSVGIPGASAAPQRAIGICGDDTKVVTGQVVGGMAGMGFPDLATQNAAGVLQVAEIKPAAVECLIDGEVQLLRYIDQGNARDLAQLAWKAAQGITVVSPMLESTYQPPTFQISVPGVGSAELTSAWCGPGLLAYAVKVKGAQRTVPVRVPSPKGKKSPLRKVADFLQELIETGITSGAKLDDALMGFYRANPDLINIVIAASVGVIVGTLAEDIATLGAGILDDLVMIPIAARAIMIARQAAAALAIVGGAAAAVPP